MYLDCIYKVNNLQNDLLCILHYYYLGCWDVGTLKNLQLASVACGCDFQQISVFLKNLIFQGVQSQRYIHCRVCRGVVHANNHPFIRTQTVFLVHDSYALGEKNDFMHHLYSATRLYSPQRTCNIETPHSYLRNSWITIRHLTPQATMCFTQRPGGSKKRNGRRHHACPAHSSKHRRDLIVLLSLPRLISISVVRKTTRQRRGRVQRKIKLLSSKWAFSEYWGRTVGQ